MLVLRLLFSFSDLRFSLPLGRMGHTDVATPPPSMISRTLHPKRRVSPRPPESWTSPLISTQAFTPNRLEVENA